MNLIFTDMQWLWGGRSLLVEGSHGSDVGEGRND